MSRIHYPTIGLHWVLSLSCCWWWVLQNSKCNAISSDGSQLASYLESFHSNWSMSAPSWDPLQFNSYRCPATEPNLSLTESLSPRLFRVLIFFWELHFTPSNFCWPLLWPTGLQLRTSWVPTDPSGLLASTHWTPTGSGCITPTPSCSFSHKEQRRHHSDKNVVPSSLKHEDISSNQTSKQYYRTRWLVSRTENGPF